MSTPSAAEVEALRMQQLVAVNAEAVKPGEEVPIGHMTTDEARERYDFIGFQAPYVVVRRKSDGQRGTLTFTHNPRYYFDFTPV